MSCLLDFRVEGLGRKSTKTREGLLLLGVLSFHGGVQIRAKVEALQSLKHFRCIQLRGAENVLDVFVDVLAATRCVRTEIPHLPYIRPSHVLQNRKNSRLHVFMSRGGQGGDKCIELGREFFGVLDSVEHVANLGQCGVDVHAGGFQW